MGIEDPEVDVAEQQRPAAPDEERDPAEVDETGLVLPLEADPADVAQQHREAPVETDERD